MKSSYYSQNIFPDLVFDESVIRKAYEDLLENPCRFYFELKKAFKEISNERFSDLINSLIFMQ